MDRETAKRLLSKGVDPSIILDELLGDEDAATPASAPEPAPEVTPATVPEEPKPQPPAVDPVLAAIAQLTGTIQTLNARTRSFEPKPAETVDDILAAALGGGKQNGR